MNRKLKSGKKGERDNKAFFGDGSFVFFVYLLLDLLGLLGVGNLQTLFIVFIEAIVLEGVHRYRGLEDVLEVNEAQKKLSPRRCCFLYQSNTLKTWKWAENICLKK